MLTAKENLPEDRSNPWYTIYDCANGFIVEAENEAQARLLASEQHGDEGAEAWLNPEYSSCDELKLTGEPSIWMRDFHAG